MVMIKINDRYVPVRKGVKRKGIVRPDLAKNNSFPKDKDGNVIGGPGRPKGVPNKVSGEAKQMIALAFEGIGGLPRLIEWADQNPGLFYTQVYPKIIALSLQGKINVDINHHGEEARRNLEAAFLGVINARRAGSEDPAVYVDGERLRDVTPQLVVSRKTGTNSS